MRAKKFKHSRTTLTLAEWASRLGITKAAMAQRVRAYEAGEMPRKRAMARGRLRPLRVKGPRASCPQVAESAILVALRASGGNVTAAAEALNISNGHAYRLVKRYAMRAVVAELRRDAAPEQRYRPTYAPPPKSPPAETVDLYASAAPAGLAL